MHQSKQVAAFQLEAVHEEIAAGFFKVFDKLGMGSQAYFNERISASRGNFYDTIAFESLDIDFISLTSRPEWAELREKVRQQNPDVLYFNTLQRQGQAMLAEALDKPVLGVIHNPTLFKNNAACRELAQTGKLDVFGLSPHVCKSIERAIPELQGRVHLHNPYVWQAFEDDPYDASADVLDIVIPGAVSFTNRDFAGLLSHLTRTQRPAMRPVKFSILAGGPDRARLEEIVAAEKLDHLFDFAALDPTSLRVPQSVYLRRLSRCHAVLPLLPAGRTDYLRSKISTGIVAAIGVGKPILAPPNVADAYGITIVELPDDRPFDISEANLDPDNLTANRREILETRDAGLAHNEQILRKVLSHSLKHNFNMV